MTKKLFAFTLLEMLVTLALIAILSSIAMTNYQQQVMKTRRIDAKESLMKLATEQEKYYNQHLSYSADLVSIDGLNHGSEFSDRHFYQLSVTIKQVASDGIDSFILKAVAINSQSKDKECQQFVISQTSQKQALDENGNSNPLCW
ncbi:type IV pilin protein [Thalassotalea crassostreae]|uniref:type IV pilin protein n=1 Tax=Thalassotalea crassostreae TaxID=1763536 RepID=UPI00083954F0|nr:type IV pilin protein [Thalassotalea crassostreae]